MDENVLVGKTLLVVDDETDLRDIVASELEFMGAKVFQAENITAAQKILLENPVDLIVSDIRMPGGTGVDLLDIVKAKNVSIPPVILITGFADITTEDAFNKGAEALLNKPFKLDDLIKLVVRYTSPFDQRFSEEVVSHKTIEAEIKGLGRGGAVVEMELHGRKFDSGECVNFHFKYNNKSFEGIAACRWLKQPDQGSSKARVGFEFLKLGPSSLSAFKSECEGKKIIPYIPAHQS